MLALFGREALKDDGQAGKLWTGNGGIALAQNVASEAEVDAMMARARSRWRENSETAAKTFWGGYDGYFAEPTAMSGKSPSIPLAFG